ncbi:uncharacterized protein J8A68_006081 [[Candida] subhashii]|uniref:Agglutinin-like protein N-terminal domain-containing protein n=1 Tax=[Candida] subhashii TaxID=561895 RepID=A0A8J5UIS3_9ASCO|nr:uncharacterized protein J8A68_006081 [[Candida] subhashii]KAG7660406.1 hypothetical protein J8A68_006081 [[Candida] subhashii]
MGCVVDGSVVGSTLASGNFYFQLSFNTGGSSLRRDLNRASYFGCGGNTVSFYVGDDELSTNTIFPIVSVTDPTVVARENATVKNQQVYLFDGRCPQGYQSATASFSILDPGGRQKLYFRRQISIRNLYVVSRDSRRN